MKKKRFAIFFNQRILMNKNCIFYIFLIYFHISLVACTSLTIVPTSTPKDLKTEGLRYYRPYPYLQISEMKAEESQTQKLQFKILWLPDLSQEYAIQVRPGFGSIDFKPTLEDGWNLVSLDAKLDSKTKEIIEATSGLIEKGAKVFSLSKSSTVPIKPGIYRFVFDLRSSLGGGQDPNPNFGKIIGVDYENPIVSFEN